MYFFFSGLHSLFGFSVTTYTNKKLLTVATTKITSLQFKVLLFL